MTAEQILADMAEVGREQYIPTDNVVYGDQQLAHGEIVFEDQTLQEVDIDLLVHGVQKPALIKFKQLSLFCRKPAGAKLGVHVGKQKRLRNVGLKFTNLGKVCGDDFVVQQIGGDRNCFFRTISYLLLGVEDKHDIIRAKTAEYIIDPENLVKLRIYI